MNMKKLAVFLILVLSACSKVGDTIQRDRNQKVINSTLVCVSAKDEEYSFFAENDAIKSMQEIFYMSYEEAGIYEEKDPAQIKDEINQKLSKKYSSIPGVSAIVDEVVENRIKIIFMIDFEVADMEQLVENGILDEGETQNQFISLKKTEENYTKNGFACEYK